MAIPLAHLLEQSMASGLSLARYAPLEDDLRIRIEPLRSLGGLSGAGFTPAEAIWICRQGEPHLHRASTWLARVIAEDVLKMQGVRSPRVEILRDDAGAPIAALTDGTLRIARSRGISGVGLSLSHAPHLVAGVAMPLRETRPPTEANRPRARPQVLGVGIDVLATKHIDDVFSYPRGSLERLFTASELRSAEGLSRRSAVVRLSIVLAAKEASFKALGPLLRARRALHQGSSTDLATDFRDVEIVGIDTPSPVGVPRGTLVESIRQSRPFPRLDALPVAVAHDRELAGAVALCVSCPST
jgi:phosphopantetheine--protein transferase-like protein